MAKPQGLNAAMTPRVTLTERAALLTTYSLPGAAVVAGQAGSGSTQASLVSANCRAHLLRASEGQRDHGVVAGAGADDASVPHLVISEDGWVGIGPAPEQDHGPTRVKQAA